MTLHCPLQVFFSVCLQGYAKNYAWPFAAFITTPSMTSIERAFFIQFAILAVLANF